LTNAKPIIIADRWIKNALFNLLIFISKRKKCTDKRTGIDKERNPINQMCSGETNTVFVTHLCLIPMKII